MEIFCPRCRKVFRAPGGEGRITCPHCGAGMVARRRDEARGLSPAPVRPADAAVAMAAARRARQGELVCSGCNLPFVPESPGGEAACPYCGTANRNQDPGATAVMSEREAAAVGAAGVRPLGELAVERGFISPERLEEALAAFEERRAAGSRLPLGEMMVGAGVLSRAQLELLLAEQGGRKGPQVRLAGYEPIKSLGEGAFGEVVLARQVSTDCLVAIKVLRPEVARDEQYLGRFLREGRLAQELQHPNIVRALDVGECDGLYYLAMEYVEGRSLYDFMSRDGKLPEPFALHLLVQVARGLEHAHSRGIVHRDIKPDNILIDSNGVPKLADLGLARHEGATTRLTHTGTTMGTPHYMSPEQARGRADVDIRSDIYSLGATLYHLVTGRPPFDGPSAAVILSKHLTEEAPWPQDVNPEVSDYCCMLVRKMLAKEPEERYATPAEMIPDLERVANGKVPRGAPPRGRSSIGLAGAVEVPVVARLPVRPAHRSPRRCATPPTQAPAESGASPGPRAESPAARKLAAPTVVVLSLAAGMLLGVFAHMGISAMVPASRPDPEGMYHYAEMWWKEHPREYDEAAAKFAEVIEVGSGTPWAMRARDAIREIRNRQKARQGY